MTKKKITLKPATKPHVPMIAGKSAVQKIAKVTARIAEKAIARVDEANAKAAADESKVKISNLAKTKSKSGKRADGRMSGLDAAALVLADTGKPMTSHEVVEAMITRGHWKSGGKTPHATIYSAIIREIAKKGGAASRFRKTERGLFAFNPPAKAAK